MPTRIVESKQNPRLKELRQAFARPGAGASNRVAIEGPHLIEEALRSNLLFDCVFVARESEWMLSDALRNAAAEVVVAPRAVLQSALDTETPQAIAALVQPPRWTWDDLLHSDGAAGAENRDERSQAPLIVIAAGLQDPGNLGAIIRSAEAFGAHGVLTLPGTVNPWNPKAVRASTGSVFRLPVLEAGVDDCLERLRAARIQTLVTDAAGAVAAEDADLAAAVALIIGNEGNGVPAEVAARADGSVRIPCSGPVESLNATVAASILLYEAARQRRRPA